MAEVAGVLLDHVEYHLAQRDGRAVLHRAADGEVGRAGDELLRQGDLLAPGAPGAGHHRRSATAPAQSASSTSSDQYSGGASACAITRRNQLRSTSAMWRIRPSRDMVEGGTERRASCSASRPAHFSSSASR